MDGETNSIHTGDDPVTREKLARDLKTLIRDAEEMIKATAGDLGERTKEARERLSTALDTARDNYRDLEGKALEGAKATDKMIRSHPYESIGIAFGVGLLIGVLVNRR